MKKIYIIISFFLLALTSFAWGDLYQDSRSAQSGGGINATDSWFPGFTINWDIKWIGGEFPWEYKYTIYSPNKEISHWIFEVSENAIVNDFDFGSIQYEGPKNWIPGSGNPEMPSNIYGIKFDNLSGNSNTFTFYSKRAPMWGDFYAKDGKDNSFDVIAYNIGFGTNPQSPFTNWIAVPDTKTVPEPSLLLLLGLGLTAVGVGSKWMRKR